jgi:hypothetical protein
MNSVTQGEQVLRDPETHFSTAKRKFILHLVPLGIGWMGKSVSEPFEFTASSTHPISLDACSSNQVALDCQYWTPKHVKDVGFATELDTRRVGAQR